MPTRRTFLARSGLVGLAGGVALSDELFRISPLNADEATVTPDIVQLRPEIEPIVRLIESTPRDRCLDMALDQLRQGLPYRQFLAALFLAGIRNVSPQPPGFKFHCVFVIHAAHQLSLDAPASDRLLPLFWALDEFKSSQERDIQEGDFRLAPVRGRLPAAGVAWQEFHSAMAEWDEERADRAIVALVRSRGAHEIIEQLWQYGARDYRNIGHKAIFVANTWRTLQTIGWQHAEPALRSLVLGLLDFGKEEQRDGFGFADQAYQRNVELVRSSAGQLREDWTAATNSPQVTEELVDAIRSGELADVCQTALAKLLVRGGGAGAPELWDAVHLAAGELMMRQPGIFGIHTVTSADALRYAYETAAPPESRLLMLLQAVGWMCQFRTFMASEGSGLNDIRITQLAAADTAQDPRRATDEIFAEIRVNPTTAAAKAMAFARQHSESSVFGDTARRMILRKASDPHDYKYAAAIFDDYAQVSPAWRPHLLATATYHLPGTTTPDSPLMLRAAEAIRAGIAK